MGTQQSTAGKGGSFLKNDWEGTFSEKIDEADTFSQKDDMRDFLKKKIDI